MRDGSGQQAVQRYLYGITQGPARRRFRGAGIEGCDVETVHGGSLAALVGPAPARLDVLRHGRAHVRALETIMAQVPVVPARFGTIVPSEGELKGFLVQHQDPLAKLLDRVRGRVELSVKASWCTEPAIHELRRRDPSLAVLAKAGSADYADMVEAGRRVKEALDRWGQQVEGEILAGLQPLASETRVNPPLGEAMFFSAAFLVDHDHEATFDQAVQALDAQLGAWARLTYVRSPPYHFASMEDLA